VRVSLAHRPAALAVLTSRPAPVLHDLVKKILACALLALPLVACSSDDDDAAPIATSQPAPPTTPGAVATGAAQGASPQPATPTPPGLAGAPQGTGPTVLKPDSPTGPGAVPSGFPTALPSGFPTALPSGFPTALPTVMPTVITIPTSIPLPTIPPPQPTTTK
jgi:hypothetical protein